MNWKVFAVLPVFFVLLINLEESESQTILDTLSTAKNITRALGGTFIFGTAALIYAIGILIVGASTLVATDAAKQVVETSAFIAVTGRLPNGTEVPDFVREAAADGGDITEIQADALEKLETAKLIGTVITTALGASPLGPVLIPLLGLEEGGAISNLLGGGGGGLPIPTPAAPAAPAAGGDAGGGIGGIISSLAASGGLAPIISSLAESGALTSIIGALGSGGGGGLTSILGLLGGGGAAAPSNASDDAPNAPSPVETPPSSLGKELGQEEPFPPNLSVDFSPNPDATGNLPTGFGPAPGAAKRSDYVPQDWSDYYSSYSNYRHPSPYQYYGRQKRSADIVPPLFQIADFFLRVDTHSCLLRIACEIAAHTDKKHFSFDEILLMNLFVQEKYTDGTEETKEAKKKFAAAKKLGEISHNEDMCELSYPHCPKSKQLLSLWSLGVSAGNIMKKNAV